MLFRFIATVILAAVYLTPGRAIVLAQEIAPPNEIAPATLDGKSFLTIPGDQWKLLWNDEFSGDSLDAGKWTSGLPWAGDDGGHRHHNAMYASLISDDDVLLHDGMINLLTKKEDAVDLRKRTFHYTQAFIQTEGKFSYTYGYCEIRARCRSNPVGDCGRRSGCCRAAGRRRMTSLNSGPVGPSRTFIRVLPIAFHSAVESNGTAGISTRCRRDFTPMEWSGDPDISS